MCRDDKISILSQHSQPNWDSMEERCSHKSLNPNSFNGRNCAPIMSPGIALGGISAAHVEIQQGHGFRQRKANNMQRHVWMGLSLWRTVCTFFRTYRGSKTEEKVTIRQEQPHQRNG